MMSDESLLPARIVRHSLSDRILHWLFAISILTLLATGILPKLGFGFAWLEIHWISGVLLMLFTLCHLLRVLLVKPLRNMWIGAADFRAGKAGKFSLAQKLLHNVVTLVTLIALVTGGLMMVRIDTPFWQRDPYWLATDTWGLVYVLHGLMALFLVSIIMLHGYFALRPEKRGYLRAIFRGWITREEFAVDHDPERWKLK
jgi:cytochrome b subunit of formate dehydrogenase